MPRTRGSRPRTLASTNRTPGAVWPVALQDRTPLRASLIPVNLGSGDVSGVLLVPNGGTGRTSFTSNGVVYGNGTGQLRVTAGGGANTVLAANGSTPVFTNAPQLLAVMAPTWLSPTGAAITVTPNAGNSLFVNLSTTGDFVVNTNQFVVDTSAANVGFGTATPSSALHVVSNQNTPIIVSKPSFTGLSLSAWYPNVALNMYHDGTQWRSFAAGYVSNIGTDYINGTLVFAISTGSAGSANAALGSSPTTNVITITAALNVGLGSIATPLARLHLPAGSATAGTAPLAFTSGALLTAPVAGRMEFLTDAFYGTITTGAARKTFAFLESPALVTPDIGAATGTSLVLSGKLDLLSTGGAPRIGTATLVAGTVTVNTTAITATALVFLQRITAGGTLGNLTYTQVNGTSITINSDVALDTSVVAWTILEAH